MYGSELAHERGHRTRVPRRAIENGISGAGNTLVDVDISLHVDPIIVECVPFLVSMATPMKCFVANFLSSKSAVRSRRLL